MISNDDDGHSPLGCGNFSKIFFSNFDRLSPTKTKKMHRSTGCLKKKFGRQGI